MTATQERDIMSLAPAGDIDAWLRGNVSWTGDGRGHGTELRKDALLAAYNAAAEGAEGPVSARAMGEAVKRAFPGVRDKQIRASGGKAWVWVGLSLGAAKEDAEPGQIIPRGIPAEATQVSAGAPLPLPTLLIDPSPYQPRVHFDAEKLQELAETIREHGLIQPIVVRRVEDRYELLAGERRLRATARAGLETIPALVRDDVDDRTAAQLVLLENLQREDLNPIEIARGCRGLQNEAGFTQELIAEKLGVKQPWVAKHLGLLDLPEEAQRRIEAGELTTTHGVALLKWKEHPAVTGEIAARAAENQTPARDLEKAVLPFANGLARGGLIRVLDYNAPFRWQEVCAQCPYGAFLKADYYGYCLYPPHYQQLADEATAPEREKAARALARTLEVAPPEVKAKIEEAMAPAAPAVPRPVDEDSADDPEELEADADYEDDDPSNPEEPAPAGVLDLARLPYGAYADLDYGRPAGCTDQCPCFAVGMKHGKAVKVCLQPGRLNRLKGAKSREEKQELKRTFDQLLAQVSAPAASEKAAMDRRRRALAQLVWQVVKGASIQSKRAATAGADPQLAALFAKPESYSSYSEINERAWPILARQRPEDLVDIAAEVLVREELRERLENKSTTTPLTSWYLGHALPAAADEQPALAAPAGEWDLTPLLHRRELAASRNPGEMYLLEDDSGGYLLRGDATVAAPILGNEIRFGRSGRDQVPFLRLAPNDIARSVRILQSHGRRPLICGPQGERWPDEAPEPPVGAAAGTQPLAQGTEIAWMEDGRERRGTITGVNGADGRPGHPVKYLVAGADFSTLVQSNQEGLRVVRSSKGGGK